MIAPASRQIGKYVIREKLGRGGMADVYLAQDTALGHTVALKIVERSADQDTRDAIVAERRGAVLQEHLAAIDPRVVKVYEAGDTDGFFYVAMEYIDGQDLAELMRRGPLAVEFAADVAIAVARTLDNAHHLRVGIEGKDYQGVIHGDIKPKNIRIDARGEVRVLDFGIAKALSMSRRLTRNEFGSVPYASPERLDTGDVDALSDLWSLSVMLYEMVTGRRPYDAETTERLERMIRSRVPPPPAPDPCPEPLRRILMKAMSPEPAVRYQSASELADELHAFRQGKPVKAAVEDLDATRRTARGAAVGDETRRTGSGPAIEGETRSTGTENQPPALAPRRRSAFRIVMRGIGILAVASVMYAGYSLVSDYFLYQHGREFERQIQAEQLTDPEQIWTKWTELSKGNSSSFLLRGPRKAVKQKFVEAADHVIATYRTSETQPVYEKDWERARSMLARGLAIDPDDSIRGELRLCEGHIARINGTTHRSAAELDTAVQKFTESARLMPKSPDPELGLARVYVYGLKDIDKANAALQQAQQRGYQLGNREKSQLADGYRDRGDRLWWDSRNVRGLPQEKDQIQRAQSDYNQALGLYQGIAPYGNANAQIVRVQSSLESVRSRLEQIAQEETPHSSPSPLSRVLNEVFRRVARGRGDGRNP
jgi:tetratricopeptide (TPR) repeat protein/predicted Ser/Thr protein kinase